MTIHVSNRLRANVLDAMRVVGEPISSNELAKVLGKSPQAVRQALSSSGAIKIDDSRPILWALPGSIRMEQRVPAKFSDVDYVVSTKQTDDIVAIWNAQREAVGTSLTQLEIVSTMKPGKVAEQVGSLAGSLAALAYALDQVKSMPDWYEILTDKE